LQIRLARFDSGSRLHPVLFAIQATPSQPLGVLLGDDLGVCVGGVVGWLGVRHPARA